MQFENTISFAQSLDETDSLKKFRTEFIIPKRDEREQIYFLGNSLGLQPKRTPLYIMQVLAQWNHYGVEGFFMGDQPWLNYHEQLVLPLSKIVGALPQEIVVMNQLTVNLHLLLVSFYQPTKKRNKIICESKAFPSDQYMLETHIKQRGLNPKEILIEILPGEGEVLIDEKDIIAAIEKHKEELALVLWGGANYYTGQVFDMQKITEAAHNAGAIAGFDLAHAAGNIKLKLHEWDVDFACWCNYKYLNSGPGAVAGAYIHERYHTDISLQRFAGWWGYKKEKRFLMEPGFDPIPSAEGWQLSTPSPVLYAAHKAALEIFDEAGFNEVTAKGHILSDYLLFIIDDINHRSSKPLIKILTPRNPSEKGCQVSMLMLKNGKQIFDVLTKNGVFADWREPGVIRVAPVPLYNTFEEIWRFGKILELACKEASA
jgi:kynureninase